MTKERFREIIVNSQCSYKFLGAEEGHWIGVDDNGKERDYFISEMPKDYKENCIRYLEKHEENIKSGIFLQGAVYNRADRKELIRLGCDAMQQKIRELSI